MNYGPLDHGHLVNMLLESFVWGRDCNYADSLSGKHIITTFECELDLGVVISDQIVLH